MSTTAANNLPDLLRMTSAAGGDEVIYRFANGMTLKTEVFNKDDALRILPLGSPQASLMNHLANFPEFCRNKYVFEPFAGSGPLGILALVLDARHVDFLDINPRAAEFHRENARLNNLSTDLFTSIQGDIADFRPKRAYGLVLANPPFVPTPTGIEGTITSNGGPDGNRLVETLFKRLDDFLEANGEAFVYLFQIVAEGRPLVLDLIGQTLNHRPVELTPSQAHPIPFDTYCKAYLESFPGASQVIEMWRSDVVQRYGDDVTLSHYIAHVKPKVSNVTSATIVENFAEKFGEAFLVPSNDTHQLALGRVLENFLPIARSAV